MVTPPAPLIVQFPNSQTTAMPLATGVPAADLFMQNIAARARAAKTKKKAVEQRMQLWPEIPERELWLRGDKTRKGFTTMPRAMPLIMEMVNSLSKRVSTNGKSVPAGITLLGLWCRVFEEGMVRIDSELAAALESGYTGERAVSTWREHLRVLKALGFIDFKEGSGGPAQYVLLFNPYYVAKRLHDKGWVQPQMYAALKQRAADVGATDLEEELPEAAVPATAEVPT